MAAAVSPRPSFDCAKPSEIEALICGDPELSAADRRLAAFYDIAKAGALGTGSNQLATQRDWLKERDKSCARGAWKEFYKNLRNCIVAEYDERLEQLAIANLMASPKESMAELGRIRPKAVPLYQAAHDYASIDDSKRRIDIVEADLAPIYATLDANTREHLSPPFATLATAREAAASDVNFAAFFAIYATLGLEDNGVTWPCAVLVKRPSLVAGLGSYFGGAIDGAIPTSDCEAALPATDEVTALSDKAARAQPFEQGTIRFSTGRDYIKLQDAVRLHQTEVWETKAGNNNGYSNGAPQKERAWRRRHKAEIDKAESVLEAYYVKYFGVVIKTANKDAWSAIDVLIREAFKSYDG
ncbi:MAG TPA: lysozyme inhibitor LprI family protein [Phenylobacterium sp.]|jgi:uncharacterized protein|nr:lysozyme inhibitor LprI family protein [Phenylobacterium sp.]